MDDHVSRILKMLEDGKISAAEAEKLIAALRTEGRAGTTGAAEGPPHHAEARTEAAGGASETERGAKSFEFRWSRKGSLPFDLSDLGRQITEAVRRIDPERIAREARTSVERESRRWRDRMRGWGKVGDGPDGRPENEEGLPVARSVESLDYDVGTDAIVHVEDSWGDVSVVGGADRVTVELEKQAWATTQEEADLRLRDLKVECVAHQASADMPSRLEIRVSAPAEWRDGTVNLRLRVPSSVSLEASTSFGEVRAEGLTGPVTIHAISGGVVLEDIRQGAGAEQVVRAETISGDVRATRVERRISLTSKSGDLHAEELAQGGEIVSVSGDVRARAINGSRLEAKSVSGDVVVEDVGLASGTDILIESVSGDTSLAHARGSVALKTVSGDVSAKGLDAATVQGQTVSGDVRICLDAAFAGTLTCNTVSGDVGIEIPSTSSFRFTLGTQSGDLSCDHAVRDESRTDTLWTGTVGTGDGTLTVQTRSGDARLARRDQSV